MRGVRMSSDRYKTTVMPAPKEEIEITIGPHENINQEKFWKKLTSDLNVESGRIKETAINESYYREVYVTQDPCMARLKVTV